MKKDYLTPGEVARRLRVDDTTVRRWIRLGILEALTITEGKRHRHRIKRTTIELLEKSHPVLEPDIEQSPEKVK